MKEMNERRIPNLADMDEREAARFHTEGVTGMSPEWEYQTRHEDYVMEMLQSGERFRGRENMRKFQEAFGDHSTPPSIRLRRVIVRKNLWAGDSVIYYGEGQVFHGAAILELRDGKIWRDTRYYAEPFEAPEWRAQWVERMESGEPVTSLVQSEPGNEMDEHEIERLIERNWEKIQANDFVGAHEWYAEDCVVEWPQSGERIRGKENLLALREAYPADVGIEVRRVIGRRDLGVSEYVIRYDGRPVNVLAIVEFVDGMVARETHYFAEPFEAPEWRAQWVENTDL